MDESDHELIRAAGQGDRDAFERFVNAWRGRIFSFLYRYLGDRPAAEDLSQEVFLRVYQAASRFEPMGKVSTWIFTIAYRLAVNELKRRLRKPLTECDLSPSEIQVYHGACAEPVVAWELEQDFQTGLAQLPETQRAALLLRVNEGLNYEQIGTVLSVSQSGVESLLFRARKQLRRIL